MAETPDDRPVVKATTESGKARAPKWASEPFRDFLNYFELQRQVLNLTIRGISVLRGMPDLLQALEEVKATEGEKEAESTLEAARKEAELAQREADSDFPTVHSQWVVALWSNMESLLHRFAVQWLVSRPETLLQEPWTNLKARIGDYEGLDQEQKAQYLIDALERTIGSHLKQGVNRFESVFDALGLKGSVDGDTKDAIFELHKVRNVIVHKRGIADRRFCTACPWLKLEPGQQVLVSHEMAMKYDRAVHQYVTELVFRCGEFFGVADIRDRVEKKVRSTAKASGLNPSEQRSEERG